jgi:ABC-type protease/lipase transport system fused ATPase/permease subunit
MTRAAVRRWAFDALSATRDSSTALERSATVLAITKWLRLMLQVGVTGVGAMLVIDNQLSMGGMIATSLLVGRAMSPIEQIAAAWGPTGRAFSAWRRASQRLKAPLRRPIPPQAGAGHINAENVLLIAASDQRPVLRSINFSLLAGEALCVFGANRAGKSALARVLVGAVKPQGGAVRLDGVEVSGWRPTDPQTSIGYMPQSLDLLPGTIGENIARFTPDADGVLIAAAKAVGIHDMIAALPQGYDTDIANAPLSEGTLRLIMLARAAFGTPSLLVLDEPATHLDAQGIEAVRRFLACAKKNRITAVILSNANTFLALADKVMVLEQGRVTAFGPRDQIVGVRPNPALTPLAVAEAR